MSEFVEKIDELLEEETTSVYCKFPKSQMDAFIEFQEKHKEVKGGRKIPIAKIAVLFVNEAIENSLADLMDELEDE